MRSRRSAVVVLLALSLVLAGCSGAPTGPPADTASGTPVDETTTEPTASSTPTSSPSTTTPAYGPSLRLEATAEDLNVSIRIYNSTFVTSNPTFDETYRLDSGESIYLTNELHGLDAARVVLTVNDTEVWNSSLDLDAGYTVEMNESDATVAKSVA